MGIKKGNVSKKSRGDSFSNGLYIVALVVALVGVALLVNNIMIFKNTVSQAVAQGYAIAEINKQLIPSQLLPGVFEAIGLYGGTAFVLFGVGKVNKKVSKCLMLLTKDEVSNDTFEESISSQNVAGVENAETTEQAEVAQTVKEV